MTWAGKQSEQPRSFQSPETYLLLTFPFIERAYRRSRNRPKNHLYDCPANQDLRSVNNMFSEVVDDPDAYLV